LNGLDTFEEIKKATTKNNKKAEALKLTPVLPTSTLGPMILPAKTKKEFIEDMSVSILMALIEHSGKCLDDHVNIAVERANQLAEMLGYDD